MKPEKRPATKAELEERVRAIAGVEGEAEIALSTFAAVSGFVDGVRTVSYVKGGGVPADRVEPPVAERTPPEPQSGPRDEEIARLRAELDAANERNAELEAQLATAPLGYPDEGDGFLPQLGDRLSDWDPDAIGAGVEAAPAEQAAIPESIAKLMAENASLTLTEAFEKRINTLNNARLNLTIEFEEEAELDRLLTRYHDLAKRGDRS